MKRILLYSVYAMATHLESSNACATAGEYENILTEVRGKVAIITLHRPKVRLSCPLAMR